MTRKLHNTLMAVIASSSLLVVGLIVSAPLAPDLGPVSLTSGLASIEAASGVSSASGPVDAAPARSIRSARRGRPSLAMPFFSFAPRG